MKYKTDCTTIYMAGDLFNHKDLMGNRLLARKITELANDRYRFNLPQNVTTDNPLGLSIKESDISLLLQSQAALFNFDGTDLDSGTVSEFMIAVFLGIPAVLLRTDFRSAGDDPNGEPWNLMCSGYPGTRSLIINSMALYLEIWPNSEDESRSVSRYYDAIATPIIERFDSLLSEPPRFGNLEESFLIYKHFLRTCGGKLEKAFGDDILRECLKKRFE